MATAPLLQYGYGAYGLSSDPYFSSRRLSLLDRGFVFAIAQVRGGQELGRRWYDHGRLLEKRHSFEDFIDVTRWLVAQGYADPSRVVATGGSAGGLLVGAVANLAPQDYRAIVAHVPFVDVVTTMLDSSIPLTTNEYDEWGDPHEPSFYDYMLSYSPYDNVRPQEYPAMLVSTGLWDSQVQYFEPAKWVAKLRRVKTDDRPLYLRIEMEAGHGGRTGRFRQLHESAEDYAFILDQVGLAEEPEEKNGRPWPCNPWIRLATLFVADLRSRTDSAVTAAGGRRGRCRAGHREATLAHQRRDVRDRVRGTRGSRRPGRPCCRPRRRCHADAWRPPCPRHRSPR